MEKGLNTELYWKNDDPTHTVSMVPTSAITGEGIPDLLLWLVRLTQVRRLCVCCVEIYHWFGLSSRKNALHRSSCIRKYNGIQDCRTSCCRLTFT